MSPEQTCMPARTSRLLLCYLLLAGTFSLWMTCSLWAARAPIPALQIFTPHCTGTPNLTGISPDSVNAAADILIVGCDFSPTTQVKLNGTPRAALMLSATHLRISLTDSDVATPGAVLFTLSNQAIDFGSTTLRVTPPALQWFAWTLGPDLQLLLMVLFTGAFGACIYCLKSLASYRGDRRLQDSWSMFYVVQPFQGAGIAYLLYLVIRGGFLSGTAAAKSVNPFGVCAIAGLAGTFSDVAYLKLREVFLTLFKPQDDRTGK